jgi:glycosyltransferase involved in cell wall biosynthesis
LLAWLWTCFSGAELVIDSHTGAFDGPWARMLWLHRFLSRRATTTLVTNEPLRARVAAWGARALILEDRVPDLQPARGPVNDRFSVVLVSSFAADEPLTEVLAAAAELPSYLFFVTGRAPAHCAALVAGAPANVTFTGFVPRADYVALLNRVDAVMVLVKRDLTLLCGAYEAAAVEQPLITSDWPVLRNYFDRGALYVDNSPAQIRDAVCEARRRNGELREGIRQLKRALAIDWARRCDILREQVGLPSSAAGEASLAADAVTVTP